MTLDKLLVTVFGIAGSAFVIWYFLGKNIRPVRAGKEVAVTVDGGYAPEVIEIPKGQTTKLVFTRRDPSSCLEEVVLGDFKVRKFLPMNQPVEIEINPQKIGEFTFSCGMNMFHGKLRVI